MKIGITCYPTYGGSGVLATELGKALARKGHEVHFIAYQMPIRLDSFNERVYFHEVEVFEYPLFEYYPYSLSLGVKMAEVVKYNNLDILHVHYAIPHSISAYLARKILEGRKIKFITTLHGTDVTIVGGHPSFLPVTRFAIENSNGITAVSKSLKESIINCIGVKRDIEVIYNFIDDKVFSNKEQDKFRGCFAPENEKLICHMSNFRPLKRVDKVIEVFDNVLKKGVNAKLLLVGDGPERASIERQCRERQICDRCIFLGKQEAVNDILRSCDAFILPSDTESFGLAALEAMACEVPVVATNVGGLPELVVDKKTGFLYDKEDITGMVEGVYTLLTNSELCGKMGKASAERARTTFNKDRIIEQYEQYYDTVIRS